MKVYMEPSEIAEQMGVGVRQVQKLAKQGRIPHIRHGRNIRFPRQAWEQFIAAQNEGATAAMTSGGSSHASAV